LIPEGSSVTMVVKELTAAVVTIASGKMINIVALSAKLNATTPVAVPKTTLAWLEISSLLESCARLKPRTLCSVFAMELVIASNLSRLL